MEIDFAVVADYAAVTSDGKLVVAGIFDRITAPDMPAVHPTMSLAFRVTMDPGSPSLHRVEVHLVGPDGSDVLPPFHGEMRAFSADASSPRGAQFVLSLPGVRFQMWGLYTVHVSIDGQHLRTVPFRIVQPPQPLQVGNA
jgi:Family of unknown function (DUF6941)